MAATAGRSPPPTPVVRVHGAGGLADQLRLRHRAGEPAARTENALDVLAGDVVVASGDGRFAEHGNSRGEVFDKSLSWRLMRYPCHTNKTVIKQLILIIN